MLLSILFFLPSSTMVRIGNFNICEIQTDAIAMKIVLIVKR